MRGKGGIALTAKLRAACEGRTSRIQPGDNRILIGQNLESPRLDMFSPMATEFFELCKLFGLLGFKRREPFYGRSTLVHEQRNTALQFVETGSIRARIFNAHN